MYPNSQSGQRRIILYKIVVRLKSEDFMDRDNFSGWAINIRSNDLHINISDCARSLNWILTWGWMYPLVIMRSMWVHSRMWRGSNDVLEINDASRWIWDMDIFWTGSKENSPCTNFFMLRAHTVIVWVSKLNSQPRNSKQRPCCDLANQLLSRPSLQAILQ